MSTRRAPAIGCFPLYPPVELIHAMGGTPVVLWDSAGPATTPLADAHVQPYACGIARRLAERVLAGGHTGFHALVSYNACDTLRNLPELVAGDVPSLKLHVPQQGLDAPHGALRLRRGIDRLAGGLGRLLGTTFSREAFASSVALHATVRGLIEKLQADVAAGTLSFVDLVRLVDRWHATGPGGVVHELAACHERASRATATVPARPVLVSGILPPPPRACEALERAGLRVVANDIAAMHRSSARTPATVADPGDFYLDHYLHHHPCTTLLHTADARLPCLLDLARASGARGVVLAGEKFCEHEAFEHPAIETMFKAAGLPVLRLETGTGDVDGGGALAQRLEAFAEMLPAGGASGP